MNAAATTQLKEQSEVLADYLDGILGRLQNRLRERKASILTRIASITNSGAAPVEVYRSFAREIQELVRHDRFTLFSVDQSTDLLT